MRRLDNLQTDNAQTGQSTLRLPQTCQTLCFVSSQYISSLTYSFVLDDNISQVRITRNKAKIRKGREVDDWCAEFEKLCRSRGIRVTAQRFAIYKALAEDLAHPTAESVYARLSKRLPGLSFATIYRTLQFFENEKQCSVDPSGKPCDHCAMCSSRGF